MNDQNVAEGQGQVVKGLDRLERGEGAGLEQSLRLQLGMTEVRPTEAMLKQERAKKLDELAASAEIRPSHKGLYRALLNRGWHCEDPVDLVVPTGPKMCVGFTRDGNPDKQIYHADRLSFRPLSLGSPSQPTDLVDDFQCRKAWAWKAGPDTFPAEITTAFDIVYISVPKHARASYKAFSFFLESMGSLVAESTGASQPQKGKTSLGGRADSYVVSAREFSDTALSQDRLVALPSTPDSSVNVDSDA